MMSGSGNDGGGDNSGNEPLWQQCAAWLCRGVGVLPENHRIVWPDASIQDLAYTLRDGVVLCQVAASLVPESLDMRNVNQRPQMAQFLCLKNIRVFLTACEDVYGLQQTDLFQPKMLYDYTDFARVLHTLSRYFVYPGRPQSLPYYYIRPCRDLTLNLSFFVFFFSAVRKRIQAVQLSKGQGGETGRPWIPQIL